MDGQYKHGIAPARLPPAQYAENFSDLHPPLDHHEALVESDRCYFCYDAPCMTGLPDLDRHSAVHPPDLDRQSARLGQDHLRPEHSGRHVRPRLPDRDAVRGGLRARDGRRQAGADRPAAALCHRCGDGRGQAVLRPRAARPARGSPWSAPARPGLPLRIGLPCTATRSTIFEARAEGRRAQRIRHRRLQDDRRFRPGRGRLRHRDRRHRDRERQGARPRHSRSPT